MQEYSLLLEYKNYGSTRQLAKIQRSLFYQFIKFDYQKAFKNFVGMVSIQNIISLTQWGCFTGCDAGSIELKTRKMKLEDKRGILEGNNPFCPFLPIHF